MDAKARERAVGSIGTEITKRMDTAHEYHDGKTSMIGIDLFAGAGGMSLGATLAGIQVVLAVESDLHSTLTYTVNHPRTTMFSRDIIRLTSIHLEHLRKLRRHLVVFGGPPCQGFSWSNTRTRNLNNPSNWLFREYLRVVRELQPAWVVFENVQGIVDTAQGTFHAQITDGLSDDYHLYQSVLNASDYGVPQRRSRFFLVGSRDDIPFRFPDILHDNSPTVDNAIRDLPRLDNGASVCCRRYSKVTPSPYAKRLRGSIPRCCNHLVTRSSVLVQRRYRQVPPGGNWKDIPESLMANYSDRERCHTGLYHRLRADMPSIVIGNFRKNMLIHPSEDRGLSVREAARIQSFPDWYRFSGSIGFQQQQVGNAVPPLLARNVFGSVVKSAKDERRSV